MLKLQVFGAIVGALTYPLGVAAQSGLCSYNPFLSLRPPDGSEIFVPCSLYSDDMAACWAQPECYYFDDSMQLSPECANLPVYWPYLDQTLMVTMEDADSSVTFVGGDAFGPSAKYACIPAVLASTTLCYDSVDVYPENTYVVLFGVPAGFDIIEVDLTTQLKKSKYVSMSVYALSAESPDPLGNCVVKSLGTNMALSVDSFQEYVVAIRLKRFANQTDIIGDSVAITISSDNNLYPAGDGKPIPEPLKYIGTCPFNWAEAVETACTDGPVICRYSYRYVGCTYEELNCLEYYNCDCEPFLETWRCWGLNELPTCPNDAPTLDLLGQSCDPRAKLPENPNPPPAVCPATQNVFSVASTTTSGLDASQASSFVNLMTCVTVKASGIAGVAKIIAQTLLPDPSQLWVPVVTPMIVHPRCPIPVDSAQRPRLVSTTIHILDVTGHS
jgi:hypothetical protein